MIRFFNVTLYKPLFNLFFLLIAIMPNHNVALAIIALTVLVRLLLLPLRFKSIEAMAKQRELQPEIKRIQAEHKGDRQAQSAAMMQLYKDKGANPASGCLPQLIQLPILIVLYYVFRDIGADPSFNLYGFTPRVETLDISFLWLKDITQVDPTFILPVLAGVAQFFYSRSLAAGMPQSSDPGDMASIMNKQMIFVFPLITILIGRTFPAALSLYWVVGTLIDWLQQRVGTQRLAKKSGKSRVTVSVRKKNKEA